MSGDYEVVHLDDLEAFPVDDEGLTWRPIRRRFDIRAFGINAYTAERAGQRVVEEHSDTDDEVYIVVQGRATFRLGDDEVDAPTGTIVRPHPGIRRGAVAAEPGTTVLAAGGTPGVVFEPSAWEEEFAAGGYARLGELEKARETFRAATARHPRWQGHYNWACVEAQAGEPDAALAQLERAAALDHEAVRRYAPTDVDLEPIRSDPRFAALTGP